jgi:integrase
LSGIYAQNNSPYYWLRYYNKFEEDPKKKRKSLNTKIPITEADKKRITVAKAKYEKVALVGTPGLKKLKREFDQGWAEWAIMNNSGVKLKKDLKLSEGYEKFKESRSIPGLRNFLKQKTLTTYALAVDHFIICLNDKYIYQYSKDDYAQLLFYFEKKGLSINSRSIYTRALKTLWKWFTEQSYTNKNIIETVEAEEKDPSPIPLDEMYSIVDYMKEKHSQKHHYWIIYFMLLTGVRPSSAIVQLKEDIDFKRKYITINNVKTGARKGKKFYRFPLYPELERLLAEDIGVVQGDKGRLFDQFSVVPENYTWPLSFWKRTINTLHASKIIQEKYTLKQIRPTLASYLINVYSMDIYDVKRLLDHTDIKITDKHYISYNTQRVRQDMKTITYKSLF